jgi:hypothetical protein
MVTVRGLEKLGILKSNLQRVNIKDAMAVAVAKAAMLIERGGKLAITSGPTRAFKSGALRASITVSSLTRTSARIGPQMEYGIYVHEGTRFMRARPFMTYGIGLESDPINKLLHSVGLSISKEICKGL